MQQQLVKANKEVQQLTEQRGALEQQLVEEREVAQQHQVDNSLTFETEVQAILSQRDGLQLQLGQQEGKCNQQNCVWKPKTCIQVVGMSGISVKGVRKQDTGVGCLDGN